MGLEKAIEHHKEKRRPYRGSKSFDYSCRNHGACEWCRGNRLHQVEKEEERTKDWKKEIDLDEDDQEMFRLTGIW